MSFASFFSSSSLKLGEPRTAHTVRIEAMPDQTRQQPK